MTDRSAADRSAAAALGRRPPARLPFDVVGFDLDGTLLDTSGDLAAAVNHALAHVGRPPFAVERVRSFVGKGAKIMLERALAASGGVSSELMAELTPVLLDYYEQNLAIHTVPYPGLVKALDGLAARGVRLAVCTNKSERFTLPLLRQIGLADRFAAVVGGDTVGALKPDPAPLREMVRRAGGGRTLFLGDTSNDIDGARSAGLASAAVSFGFLESTVEALAADAVIHHYDELIPLIEAWPAHG